jgi:hypothetical protein
MQKYIWIYKIPTLDYLIAKHHPFSYQIPLMDSTGTMTYQVINGVQITTPQWENIVKDSDGNVWATFQEYVYNITDIHRS